MKIKKLVIIVLTSYSIYSSCSNWGTVDLRSSTQINDISLDGISIDQTKLQNFIHKNDTESFKCLLDKQLIDNTSINKLLISAVKIGRPNIVELFLSFSANPNYEVSFMGSTPIIESVKLKDQTILNIFINHGFINLANSKGRTALMQASEINHTGNIKLLLKYGANVNLQDKDGNTALMLAAKANNEDVMLLLLEWNANITVRNKEGQQVLDWIKEDRCKKAAELIKSYATHVALNKRTRSPMNVGKFTRRYNKKDKSRNKLSHF